MMATPLEKQRLEELAFTANAIVANGKGILAADESTGTIGKRFAAINVENNEENRRAYRELLFTAGSELKEYLGGVILYEETLGQSCQDGTPFVKVLSNLGIIVGVKVDKGIVDIAGTGGESSTQGLDKLDERCKEYYNAGARFAKWRAVIKINKQLGHPSRLAIEETAHGLARYASICQAHGLVPIVEPEILMDGDHDLETAMKVTEEVLVTVYQKLHQHRVFLEGTLLKPNMVIAGQSNTTKYTIEDIARATVTVLRRTVPAAVPGITFLSGGQSELEATAHLQAINKFAEGRKPWALTFSYGRALQHSVLKTWGSGDREGAQRALLVRAKANRDAALGRYQQDSESNVSKESTFVKDYKY